MFSCEFCEIFKNTFCYRTPLVAASVTRKLANNDCVKHAGRRRFCPCRRKHWLEKSHTLAYFTLCMSWLAKMENRQVSTLSAVFFVSVIVGLKLNEKRLDFFSILCIAFFAVGGQFESSQKKKLLGYTLPVLRLIPNMTYFILGWSQ